jgi:predicted transposase/invertase (TIGR01784 family)
MDVAIQKAQERLAFVANDKEALREYHMREMALSDWTSGVNHARREGKAEGRTEGRQEGQKEIARRLKARGRPLEEIAEDTGLDVETIRRL